MEKIWLKSYPPGVPAEINPDAYQSIVELFDASCEYHKALPAFYNLGTTITYEQLDEYANQFACYLQQELNLTKGTRIAIMLPNILQYPVVLFGALRAGLVVVNVNPLYTANELTHQLKNSGAEVIVVLENFANTVQQSLPNVLSLKYVIVTKLGDLFSPIKGMLINFVLRYIHRKVPSWKIDGAIEFKKTLAKGAKLTLKKVPLSNQDIAFLQYTGGTTGISKGAILTHRNLIANMQQADAWFNNFLRDGQEIIITALPLYHIFSLTANCLYFMKIGGLNVLITNPRDVPHMIKEISKFKFSGITGVNTLFNSLLKNPRFIELDFSRLQLTLGGGMAVHRVVAEKWQEVTKKPLLEAYGLTETSPCVTINPTNLKEYNGSIGIPVPSTLVSILDDNGNELPIGEIGELAVKGPQVMRGYWQNDDETAKVFTKNGWLLTGDLACMDNNGYFYLKERKKDMILVSGFNVYPNEVEDVIAKYPGVREVAVVGIPDDNSGEIVKAFIVKDDSNITAEDIIKHCRTNLTSYKIPRQVIFTKELPKTNVGKILRRALKETA